MENNDAVKTEQKPLSVLERFRQLSRQKDQQPEVNNTKASGDVSSIVLTLDKASVKLCSKAESNPLVKEKITNNGTGFRDRGTKRSFNRDSKSTNSRVKKFHQGLLENEIGITEYITPGPGFKGIIKHRFSDFQVNEIDLAGNVVRLTNTNIPVDTDEEPVIDDMLSILTQEQWDEITQLYETKNGESLVHVDVTNVNKDMRTKIHKAIKFKFGVHIYCNTVDKDGKKLMCIGLATSTDRRVTWPRSRGEYLHFVVHKENTDATEAVHTLAYHLKIKSNKFSYAGTKDKRAVTSQRMCLKRVTAEKLKMLSLRNIFVGNYEYNTNTIRLGDLKGNRFRIALRDVDADDTVIENAIKSVEEKGFINYFGTQRFGSSVVAPTHVIGKAILQNDWKQAVELILKPRANESGYADLNAARNVWWETKDAKKAFKCLNKKNNSIEGKVLQGLIQNGPNAYLNALETLPKNTLSLYSHAYQSLLWNKIISRRVKEFGFSPIAGDLVFDDINSNDVDNEVIEGQSEDEDDKESTDERKGETVRKKLNVHVLTEEEAKETSFFNVVYPLPGFDVVYPDNVTAQWYTDLLAADGLSSEALRQNNRWFSLFGSYRKVLNKPTEVTWKTLRYNNINRDLFVSDRGSMRGLQEPENEPDGKYKALIIEFNLVPSAYATMVLREVLKCETASCHQAALTAESLSSKAANDVEERKLRAEELDSVNGQNVCRTSETNGEECGEPVNKKLKLDETHSDRKEDNSM